MNNESNRDSRITGIVEGMPSALSSNKTVISIIAFLYLLPLGTAASTSPVRALLFLITQMLVFGLLAMSFDLQLGRAGLLNFGHVALFGVGAYVMAYTLDFSVLPYPFNIIALIPYPISIILAMMVGAFVGFVMGLTTSRMRGTAFAFIALAIAMFIYNVFVENTDLSGGETGLRVPTPGIIRTAPFYLLFVFLAFVFLAAFIGMVILYVRSRTEPIGLILLALVTAAFTGVLFVLAANIVGTALVLISFLGMVVLYIVEGRKSISDPLQMPEKGQAYFGGDEPKSILSSRLLTFGILIIALVGFMVAFGANIVEMVFLWIGRTDTFFFIIPVQYYLVLTCVVITYAFIRRLVASPFGRMVSAVAQNEERAEALGYNSYLAKIVVVTISGAIAGLAGALYAPLIRTIDPPAALGVERTIEAMLFTIIGGIGTLLGPLLGAGVVVYSELNLVDFMTDVLNLPGDLWLVGLGVLYIAIVLFMPRGIVGSIGIRVQSLKQRLQRLRIGRFEFGLKDADYWVFGLLGVIGLFLLMLIFSL